MARFNKSMLVKSICVLVIMVLVSPFGYIGFKVNVALAAAPADENFETRQINSFNVSSTTIGDLQFSTDSPSIEIDQAQNVPLIDSNISGTSKVLYGMGGQTLTFQSSNLSNNFKMNSFYLNLTDATFSIYGYDGGSSTTAVAKIENQSLANSATKAGGTANEVVVSNHFSGYNNFIGGNEYAATLTFNGSNWGNVDTIKIVSNGVSPVIDNLDFSTAVLPNATPVVTTSGGNTAYTENGTSTIDSGITVSDTDNATLASATVSVTGNFRSAEDVLRFSNTSSLLYGNITGSYNAGTGVLTLTSSGATATLSQWQAALRAVEYLNSSDAPNTSNRTISFAVNDGTATSSTVTKVITVSAVNDAPVFTASGGTMAYIENATSAIDSAITVSDADHATLANATVSITGNYQSAEDVLRFTNTSSFTYGNIIATFNANTGVLTLTSSGSTATLAQWQAVLRSVTYDNQSNTPNTATRTVSFVGNDGSSNSNTATKNVSVSAADDAPVVTSQGGALAYQEGDGVSVIDNAITVSDLDSATLASGTVSITGNFNASEDVLSFTNNPATMGNISGSYNAGTGVLTLTSSGATATLAQWQSALRSVAYINSSEGPNTATRTISYVGNDGILDSSASTRNVSLTSVNDAPTITAPGSISVTEDISSVLTGISFSDGDAGNSAVTVTVSVGTGTLSATSGANVTVSGTGTSLQLTGTISAINSFIAASNLTYTTGNDATSNVNLSVTIDDGGNTGSGGSLSDNEVVILSVSAVNDAPTITAPGSLTVTEDVAGAVTGISFADVDAGTQAVDITLAIPNGSLSATSSAGVTVTPITGGITLQGTIANINAFIAASNVSYTTATDLTTTQTLTVSINDNGNVGSGGSQSVSTTVSISVTPVNDVPVISVNQVTQNYITGSIARILESTTFTDADNSTFVSAEIQISGNFQSPGDAIVFEDGQGGSTTTYGQFTIVFNPQTGIATITNGSGPANLSDWVDAFNHICFTNLAPTLNRSQRTLSIKVNDGTVDSVVVTKTITMNVAPPPNPFIHVTGITLNVNELQLINGRSGYLTATISPTNANNQGIVWSSANGNVATVDQNGVVTATGYGETTITARTDDGHFTATARVRVPEPEPVPVPETPTDPVVKGYLGGYTDGTFRPNKAITRAEIATILARVVDKTRLKLSQYAIHYSDVATSWAKDDIEWVTKVGLMSGYTNGTFGGERAITRAEMAALLSRLVLVSVVKDMPFKDVSTHWAKNAIQQMFSGGYFSGYVNGTFKPNAFMTRAEAVKVMNKVLGYKTTSGPKTPTFSDVPPTHWAFDDIELATTK